MTCRLDMLVILQHGDLETRHAGRAQGLELELPSPQIWLDEHGKGWGEAAESQKQTHIKLVH